MHSSSKCVMKCNSEKKTRKFGEKSQKKYVKQKKKKIKTEIATHKVPKRKCFVSLIYLSLIVQ